MSQKSEYQIRGVNWHVTNFYEKWFGKQKYLSEGYKSIIFVNIDVSGITENFFHEIWIQIDHQKSASDKLSDVSFMKTFTSSGAIVVNLYPNPMKKSFCYFLNMNVYKDIRFIALWQVLLFAKPFFVKIRHVSGTLK